MKSKKLQDKLRLHFPFPPTTEQDERITDIADFVSTIGNRSIFMLKGYAGTGKTVIAIAAAQEKLNKGKTVLFLCRCSSSKVGITA